MSDAFGREVITLVDLDKHHFYVGPESVKAVESADIVIGFPPQGPPVLVKHRDGPPSDVIIKDHRKV